MERARELLTGRLTREALEETGTILQALAERGTATARPEELREIGSLLRGAGQWIEGWQMCVEDLRLRRAMETGGVEAFGGYDAAGRRQ